MSPPILGDLPPCLYFDPTDDELVRLYLLPRARGQPDLIPGLIIDDDSAANTQPWKLFSRHGLAGQPDQVPAFFFVRTNGAARPDRGCDGGGAWKSMRSGEQVLSLVDGEKINWTRHNLNFQMGEGSIGWVMHEYIIADHPTLKICSVAFTGHCKKRMRAPDGYTEDCEPVSQRPRVADDSASGSMMTSTSFVQDMIAVQDFQDSASGICAASGCSTSMAIVQNTSEAQDYDGLVPILTEEEMAEMVKDLMPLIEEPLFEVEEQRLDQDAVPHVDSMATGGGGQDTIITWEGFEFDLC
ncbi:hypothetical protein QOZ80_2BG0162180 [Eleusine coracana subsp. coracana]|nr:hypothetical protein QOZ80_2BG0162180 [Eleusine coracana subsp. coracana]